ncbi:sodium:neurotransmitter symporter family protein [Oxobacter pfennigii]|uniref:Sodium:neurotransmitter symporter family protein n=1 Tax=Oxobacter pfennigii TaxID=36849 RepID=A0A0P8YFW3_9CLOT|nr:sodium-dependent transporter [Oxobacter pfennigii]KPU45958.1 sodium:neurotransmitter symporter family protein [Oxobacter pfennigii]
MSEDRKNWGSKVGLVLAMAGNAVGLGNFWKYPYLLGKHGGGAFMVPYFAALLIIGIPLMMVEWNLGRYGGKYGHGTLGPMIYLQAREGISPKAAALMGALAGMMAFAVTILVNSYYNHVIGWTLGYAVLSITGGYMNAGDTGAFFASYIQNPGYIFIFWLLSVAFLAFAVMKGIQKGIEAWAKIMMPIIYLFGFILIIRTLTLGAPVKPDWNPIAGLNFIWTPRWSELSWTGALAAAGQIFFTLSLGMGIIANYASYLKPDDDIILSGITTVSLNEFAEVILGGTIAVPIAYTFLGTEGLKSGVGLSFIALPNIFKSMAGGQFFGALWFFILFFAGFTSAIAMYNYLVALLEEEMGIVRNKASFVVFALYFVVGLPVGLEPILTKTADLAYFTEIDNWVGTYLLVVLGLIEAIAAGWFMRGKAYDEMNKGSYWKVPSWFFKVFVQFLTPVSIIILLIFSTKDYINAGYFKLVPSFVESTPILIPWVQGARLVIIFIFIIGFIQAYSTIKRKYGQELATGKIVVRA